MTCDFPTFLAAWNACQGQTTPAIHFRIAKWLQQEQARPRPRLLLMAFRSCGKSSLVGVFCAWVLARSPDTRILVLSADLALARKMVRHVKRIIEKHPLTGHLKPDDPDQWGSEKFTVNRSQELRDPSVLAKGITTNLTGTRADLIISDDVEVPKTSDSAEKRSNLRERLKELDYILTPKGMQLYVGTPHCWHTIYADAVREELGEEQIFLEGFRRLVIPVRGKDGKTVWPQRFSEDVIESIYRKTGPAHFKSQMMCEPSRPENIRLHPSSLHFYDEEIEVREVQGKRSYYLGGRQLVTVAGWWDPAFGEESGDRSVVAVVYGDDQGEFWLHHLEVIKVNRMKDKDEATQQCEVVAGLIGQYLIPSLGLEINGIGKFLPGILTREIRVSGLRSVVKPVSNRKPKSVRILEAFDALLAARALHVHRRIQNNTPFIREMEEWHPEKRGGHDDCLDAVAGALAIEPMRIPPHGIFHHQKPHFVATYRAPPTSGHFDV